MEIQNESDALVIVKSFLMNMLNHMVENTDIQVKWSINKIDQKWHVKVYPRTRKDMSLLIGSKGNTYIATRKVLRAVASKYKIPIGELHYLRDHIYEEQELVQLTDNTVLHVDPIQKPTFEIET